MTRWITRPVPVPAATIPAIAQEYMLVSAGHSRRPGDCRGMGPALTLGEDLAEAAGPVPDSAAAASWRVPLAVRLGSAGPGGRSVDVKGDRQVNG
jgi:hypothetical protein